MDNTGEHNRTEQTRPTEAVRVRHVACSVDFQNEMCPPQLLQNTSQWVCYLQFRN